MAIVCDMFLEWSSPTSQNSCDMSLQVKVTSQKCHIYHVFFKSENIMLLKIFLFKPSNYEVVCHWYQNKIPEMHQIKFISDLTKNCQNITHSRMESPCAFVPGRLVSAEWCRCPGSMAQHARESLAPSWWSSAGWMPVKIGRLSSGARRRHPVTICRPCVCHVAVTGARRYQGEVSRTFASRTYNWMRGSS